MIIVTKVNTNHSSRFVLKTQYNTSKSSVGKKIDADKEIPGTSGIVKKKQVIMLRSLRLKVGYLGLLVELLPMLLMLLTIRYPAFCDLGKKTDYNAKVSGTVTKYFIYHIWL